MANNWLKCKSVWGKQWGKMITRNSIVHTNSTKQLVIQIEKTNCRFEKQVQKSKNIYLKMMVRYEVESDVESVE